MKSLNAIFESILNPDLDTERNIEVNPLIYTLSKLNRWDEDHGASFPASEFKELMSVGCDLKKMKALGCIQMTKNEMACIWRPRGVLACWSPNTNEIVFLYGDHDITVGKDPIHSNVPDNALMLMLGGSKAYIKSTHLYLDKRNDELDGFFWPGQGSKCYMIPLDTFIEFIKWLGIPRYRID